MNFKKLFKYGTLLKSRFALYIYVIVALYLIEYFGLLLHLLEVDYNEFSFPLDINMEEVLIALKNNEKPAYKPINELNYPYRISNNRKCVLGNSGNFEKVTILYIIKSALRNRNKRDAIRKSWGRENRFLDINIKRIFMLGTSSDPNLQVMINEEYARNEDLVQADFVDSYYNNTIKTLMSFKWTVHNCPKTQFIMFADDDMYVSTKNLLKFIRSPFNKKVDSRRKRDLRQSLLNNVKGNLYSKENASETLRKYRNPNSRKLHEYDPLISLSHGRLLAGYVFFSSPMRHKSSKWYVSLAEYPFSKYPPYVTAGAYLVSYPALEDLYYTSMYTQRFKFDDVYLGILAKKCGISPLHNENFYFWRKPYSKEGYSDVIASHGFDYPDELEKIWEEQWSLGQA